MQDPQMQATVPGSSPAQLVGLATIRAIAIYREANPLPMFDADRTIVVRLDPQDVRFNRLQGMMDSRLHPRRATLQALALIGRLGDTFEQADSEQAVEALGLVIAHSSVIAWHNQLAIGPIIDLGQALRRASAEPMRAAAMVARAIIRQTTAAIARDRDRERCQLVEALGYAIAKGIDDIEIGHDIEVRDARELFERIAGEVAAGKLPRWPAPELDEHGDLRWQARDNRPSPVDPARRAAALEQLQAAADQLYAEPGRDMTMAPRAEEVDPACYPLSTEATTARHRKPTELRDPGGEDEWQIEAEHMPGRKPTVLEHDTGRETVRVVGPPGADPGAMAAVMERELANAAVRQDEDDAFMSTVATDGFAEAIRKHKSPVDPATITGLVPDGDLKLHSDSLHYRKQDADELAERLAMAGGLLVPGVAAMERRGPPPGVPHIGDLEILTPDPAEVSAARAALAGPVPGLAHDRVCPQCAAAMWADASDPAGIVHRCTNGHEHTAEQLRNLQAATLPPAPPVDRPPPVTRSGRSFPPARKP